MSPPMRSEIWTYFKLDEHDVEKAHCKICYKIYSRKGRTTSSLKNHLKSMHPEMFSLYESSDNKTPLIRIKTETDETVDPLQEENTSHSFEEEVEEEKKVDTNNFNSHKIDNLIGEMIALQNLPFSFVEGLGFRRLMQELAPTYNFKDSNFFIDFVCKKLYYKVAGKVREAVKNFDYMSLTSHIWSDPNSNAFLFTVTCHGIAENFNRISIVLKCELFDDRHTGDIIPKKINTMLSEWNIRKGHVHCLTRGESPNMKKAMRFAAFYDIDCIVHKIQLVIRRCLQAQEDIKIVKQKCQIISTHFNQSTIAQKQLQKIQNKLNQPHLQMFQDDTTQWNSTFYMFECLLKVKDALILYVNNKEIDPILPEEWKIIECCIELLKPFEEATRELGNSNAFISSVIPIIQMLGKKLDDYLIKSHDFDPIVLLLKTLKTEMSAKFSTLFEENNLYVIATYLDPRYKHKFFTPVTEEKIKEYILNIKDDVASSFNSKKVKRMRMNDYSEKDTEQPGISGVFGKPCLKDDLAMMLDSSSEDENQETPENSSFDAVLKKELLCYRNKKRVNINEDPLKWWSIHREELTILSTIARRFLSPLPASVPSEQLFNSASLFCEPGQNRFELEKAPILLFIKYNAPIFDFIY